MNKLVHIGSSNDGGSVGILLNRANRHGFIAGATGTGKTVTLQRIAEQFSRAGVPVFMADIKGDLTGIGQPDRGDANPVRHWDLEGIQGEQIRLRLATLGPDLLGRLLELTEAQQGVLNIAFHVAVRYRKPMDTFNHLNSILQFVTDNDEVERRFGRCSKMTVSTIQRKMLMMQDRTASMFGKTNFSIEDLMTCDAQGRGTVNLLDATNLISNGTLYSTFLMWMMSELFERLPEAGDLDKPRLVFFFDEAHMLFRDAPKQLVNKVEQVVRLIRSKGVGIYFVTQKPSDIPESILAQLSNRVQHALRAYTPSEIKGLKAAATSFRINPEFDTVDKIQLLNVGEALVSTLDSNGTPQVVQAIKVALPESKVGIADSQYRPKINRAKKSKSYENRSRQKESFDMPKVFKPRHRWIGNLLQMAMR